MSRYKNLKAGLKAEDFLFKDGWHDSRIKEIDSMHHQQFQMSDCEDSELFILDISACVYIDRCNNCYIFVGPCEGSIFLRNCQQCTVIGCCKQFRVRDCQQCVIALWCESQPVIESSKELVFDCFPNWGYPQLKSQMESIGYSVWNNNWWDVYDFTKSTEGLNYRVKRLSEKDLGRQKFLEVLNKITLTWAVNIIPRTFGTQPNKHQKCSILVFRPSIPIKLFWFDYKILQTRLCIPPVQLNTQLQLPQENYVFVKIASKDADDFQKIAQKYSSTCLKRIDEGLESIQDLIFVPFKDEH